MGYPSGIFTSPNSGKLQISFSGEFYSSSGGGAPAWFGGSGAGMFIRLLCSAGSRTTVISDQGPSNLIEMDYVAGTSVPVSISLLARQAGAGIYSQSAANLTIRCILMKR
jgi:hypothetical protein